MAGKRIKKLLVVVLLLSFTGLSAQKESDTLTNELKNQILSRMKHFSFGFYIEAYYNWTLNAPHDTSNLVPFSANCPIQDQIRLNVAAFELYYTSEKVRGKFAIQNGDAPNLMASPSSQWIKTIRQANFGFRIVENLWVDFGYMFNPVGYESSWGALNQISFVTVGGYFEPGSVLGTKFSYKFSEKFSAGIMAGNPFSLAYSGNTHMAGLIFMTYKPLPNLSLTYNNFFGNQALADADLNNNILYNNLIVTYSPFKSLDIAGQFDFASQTNSKMAPDTTRTAHMYSGFLQIRYAFNKHFSLTARFETTNDPDGFLTGVNPKTTRGLRINGIESSFEYRPVSFGYLRIASRYLDAYPGSKVFASDTRDYMYAIIFTTGVRF
ncbi:MAG: outer membrane beta-barrel protein [Bacteroidales bacterium]